MFHWQVFRFRVNLKSDDSDHWHQWIDQTFKLKPGGVAVAVLLGKHGPASDGRPQRSR